MTCTTITEPCRTFPELRLHGNKDVRLDTVEALPCGFDEVRIKVAYCGMCGSDLHEYLTGPVHAPKVGEKDRLTGTELPITLGHEVSGTVTELGSAVASLKVGQNVAVHPALHDAEWYKEACGGCSIGSFNLCENISYYGVSAPSGGFSPEMVVKAVNCFKLPEDTTLEQGALVEPLTIAWHSVRSSGIQAGQDAVVLGAGPIGLGIIAVLRVWGVKTIIVSELMAKRKEYASLAGANLVIDPRETGPTGADPVVAAARKLSQDGAGAHVAFDATGLQATINTAIAAVRPGGIIFNIAVHQKPALININDIGFWEKKITGGIGSTTEDWEGVIDALASGRLFTKGFVTAVVNLSDAVNGALHELINNKEHHIKILVRPN